VSAPSRVGHLPSAVETAAADSPDLPFYAAAEKIYPREVHGRFASARRAAVIGLLGLFYGVAWLPWHGHQALLFDLPARKFHIFGLTLWPQDFLYLALLLIIAALSLFFFTALAGRLWCGYACPQTVWSELFIWIEQWTEGSRSRRMKLDRSPWTLEKWLRKGSKQMLWVALAALTGFTFVGYFTPIRTLGGQLLAGAAGGWATFWVGLYGLATYGNAGFLREQVCKYMCPYARFQSAMFDKDTLIISYDVARGEPRGRGGRGGDCVDCTLCVQACPTGIDIRNGLQYECIACAACIDACDAVMDKIGRPRGLIRYTTENALQSRAPRLMRARLLVYLALLAGASGALGLSLLTRTPLILDVLRDRNALYREVEGGERIENAYLLKIVNEDDAPHRYRLSVTGPAGLTLVEPREPISVASGSVATLAARLQAPTSAAAGVHTVEFTLAAIDARSSVRERSRFLGPQP